jgi:hypothetical protein
MEYLHSDIVNYGDSKYYTVKTISVDPQYIAQLGTNYTYSVQDDYVGPELPIEFDEEERVSGSEDDVLNEFIGEIIDEIEPIFTEEEDKKIGEMISLLEEESNELPAPPDEIIIETEPVSNNNQITQTNESTDIDWF